MTKIQRITDKAAIAFSFICIVHCAIQPLLFILLPVLPSLYFLEHELFHRVIVFAVVPIGLIALIIGYLHHKQRAILGIGLMGLVFLTAIAFWGHETFGEIGEVILTSLASLIIIYAHVKNFQLRPLRAQSYDSQDVGAD